MPAAEAIFRARGGESAFPGDGRGFRDLTMDIGEDDLTSADVVALLERHLGDARLHSPPESVHALDVAGLRAPGITFWSARDGGLLLGCGALRELDARHGEIKSMHVAIEQRGRGVGAAILRHILDVARGRGYGRVSLETGSMAAFLPARRLYTSFGFQPCPPFGAYREDPLSICMTLALGRGDVMPGDSAAQSSPPPA
jgi:putative acetyltransferase